MKTGRGTRAERIKKTESQGVGGGEFEGKESYSERKGATEQAVDEEMEERMLE